jgi:mycothiol synthase
MLITIHSYKSEADLYKIQAATAEWIALAGFQGYMNVSDIALRLFNGMRRFNPGEIVRIWEDTNERIVGWAMCYPAWNSFEVQIHPDFRQHNLAIEILEWAERETLHQMHKAGKDSLPISLDVFEGDTARIVLLQNHGYSRQEHRETISSRSLDEPIPQPQLPDGFTIRSVQGIEEADKLVSLINDSFGWNWTVEGYRGVMRSPGYRAENELVVVAPDGRFAASCIMLPDSHNRIGMFENVGTGSNFRRLGLATALLNAGMQRMKTQGFNIGMVPHSAELTGATALYNSVGFRPAYKIFRYVKMPFTHQAQ